MTIKTFWLILFRILGIWLVLDSVKIIPDFISTLFSFATEPEQKMQVYVWTFSFFLSSIGLYAVILWLFFFKTDWLIYKLNLEKGFTEDRIELNIPRSTVLSFAIILIGGLMFVETLPQICRLIFSYFQGRNIFNQNPISGSIIYILAKTIIGYLLMTNSQFVVSFIDKKKVKESNINE